MIKLETIYVINETKIAVAECDRCERRLEMWGPLSVSNGDILPIDEARALDQSTDDFADWLTEAAVRRREPSNKPTICPDCVAELF